MAAPDLPAAARPAAPQPDCAEIVVSARAYCGPAHRHSWTLAADGPLPEEVLLAQDGKTYRYRLVHDLRERRPARDEYGDWMYLPAR